MSKIGNLVTKKYMLGIIVIGLLEVISFVSLITTIQRSKDFAYIINLTGRQRMLSQRITLFLHQVKDTQNKDQRIILQKEGHKYIDQFNNAHLILTGKNTEIDSSAITQEFYFSNNELNNNVERFVTQSRLYLESGINISHDNLTSFSNFTKYKLLENLEQAVLYFENESNTLTRKLIIIEISILILTFIALWLVGKLIFKPLRETIIQRELDLNTAVRNLKIESEYKSMFLSNMTHELRTPLHGVLGVTELLKETEINHDQESLLDVIEGSGKKLLVIINNILDITKLEMDKFRIERKAFTLESTLDFIYQAFSHQASLSKSKWIWDKGEFPSMMIGDEDKIKQVLDNLISNSFKFTKNGEVKMKTHFDESTSQLIVSLEDNGIGISEEKIDYIFGTFKQADTSKTKSYSGVGLGLSISRRLIEAMGGKLCVESQQGKGSVFTFNIPLETIKI